MKKRISSSETGVEVRSTSAVASISNMPVKAEAALTESMRNNLQKILSQEFQNQSTLQHQQMAEIRAAVETEIMNQPQVIELLKELGQTRRKREELQLSVECLEKELARKYGVTFARYGERVGEAEVCYQANAGSIEKNACIANAERLRKAEEKAKVTAFDRSKIMARLAIATTVGEAVVILNTVLGNGIIPTLKLEDLSQS